ncbi:MAG: trypsin-like peptidase domain-containing protein [Gemmataceae bacterium]
MLLAKIGCPTCGALLDNANLNPGEPLHCPACGTLFALPTTESPRSEPGLQRPLPGSGPFSTASPRKRKSNTGLIWLIGGASAGVVLLTIALACGLVYYFAWLKTPRGHQASHGSSAQDENSDSGAGKADPPFEEWTQDFEAAKKQAAKENKDVLILFNCSDGSQYCQAMADNIFAKPAFKEGAESQFVLVYLDFPQKTSNLAKVADLVQNIKLNREYQVSRNFPTLVLTDSEGQPFAQGGFSQEAPAAFAARLVKQKELHERRDTLFREVATADGPAKSKAAAEALGFLAEHGLAFYYKKQVQEWSGAVRQEDPNNDHGIAEVFFEADWYYEMPSLDQTPPPEMARLAKRLDDWKKVHAFKDKNRAARLHFSAGRLAAQAGERDAALKYALDGLAYRPDSSHIHQDLFRLAGEMGLSCGSGFVVAPGGYLLTNAHVVAGGGKIFIRVGKELQSVPAKVLAQDTEHDMALIQVESAASLSLTPVPVDGKRSLERGEDVAALGYPLGEMFGSGLKLTTGRVSATPESGTNNMLLLENKINPGNSGGPLCDTHGNVVGMISAKTNSRAGTDSYGLALTGQDLDKFLATHLKDYHPASPQTKGLTWPEVNRQISPSVFMIFRTP